MKSIATFCILLFVFFGYGQEFEIHENGLIYSPLAMKKLSIIVGDKNSEFRKCELTEDFKSIYQAKGIFFTVENSNRKKLKKELMENISFTDFLKNMGQKKLCIGGLLPKRNILIMMTIA